MKIFVFLVGHRRLHFRSGIPKTTTVTSTAHKVTRLFYGCGQLAVRTWHGLLLVRIK